MEANIPDRVAQLKQSLEEILQLEQSMLQFPITQETLLPKVVGRKRELITLLSSEPGPVDLKSIAQSPLVIEQPSGEEINIATNQYIYKIIYGRDPTEDERRRLEWYLQRVKNFAPSNQEVLAFYLRLATMRTTPIFMGNLSETTDWLTIDGEATKQHNPDHILPDKAIIGLPQIAKHDPTAQEPTKVTARFRRDEIKEEVITVLAQPNDPAVLLSRSLLVTEAIAEPVPHSTGIVFLGDPGSGKSQFLRCFTAVMAQFGLKEEIEGTRLAGWPREKVLIPVIIRIRELATALYDARNNTPPGEPLVIIIKAILKQMHHSEENPMSDIVQAALVHGGMGIMFDGLDEIPPEDQGNHVAGRLTVVNAIAKFAEDYAENVILLTCRSHAFTKELRKHLNWRVETVAPFTLGQVKALINSFLTSSERGLSNDQQEQVQKRILTILTKNSSLLPLTGSVWRLSVMVDIAVEGQDIPFERHRLYEISIDRMFDGWQSSARRTTLTADYSITKENLDNIRPTINRLSFDAFCHANGDIAQVRLSKAQLLLQLTNLFAKVETQGQINPANGCLNYLEQRGDLLCLEKNGENYYFVQETLLEYCVACYMAQDAERSIMTIAHYRNQDYWRTIIILCSTMVSPIVLNQIIENLVELDENGQAKPSKQWYTDVLLAHDIIVERTWRYLEHQTLIKLSSIKRGLQIACNELLFDKTAHLQEHDRWKAAYMLAMAGDLRYPVTQLSWSDSLHNLSYAFGLRSIPKANNYWCYIPTSFVKIHTQEPATLPFWVGRYPVTIGQFHEFAGSGYQNTSQKLWDQEGLQWLAEHPNAAPWDKMRNLPGNYPIINITWYEARAYCAWLTDLLQSHIPEGYSIRLPLLEEWRSVASLQSDGSQRRYPWGKEEPSSDRALFKSAQMSISVGCYPEGEAPCGASDCGGNVWEWTYTRHHKQGNSPSETDAHVVICGGGWNSHPEHLKCTHYDISKADSANIDVGFRIVLAPSLFL